MHATLALPSHIAIPICLSNKNYHGSAGIRGGSKNALATRPLKWCSAYSMFLSPSPSSCTLSTTLSSRHCVRLYPDIYNDFRRSTTCPHTESLSWDLRSRRKTSFFQTRPFSMVLYIVAVGVGYQIPRTGRKSESVEAGRWN